MSRDISLLQARLFTDRIFVGLDRSYTIGNKCRVDELFIIIINVKGWARWPVPSPELQLFPPSLLWSYNFPFSLWTVPVCF